MGFADLDPSLPASPLVQDDSLWRGEFAPRGFIVAVIAGDRKPEKQQR